MFHFFAKRLKELHEVERDERGFTLIELLVVAKYSVKERSTVPAEARSMRSLRVHLAKVQQQVDS